jgi:ParB family chromosome partitioning protein
MPALPSQRVKMIPINRITIVNPRERNKRVFKDIVENIAQLGLKRPITVAQRSEDGNARYDLVAGQGRLEAYKELGQKEVPALIVSADEEDCLVASLVENCARRQHRAIDLLQDIYQMQERGYSVSEIGRKTGLSTEYISGIANLIEKGEVRLIRSVEGGTIPLSVAIEIAEAEDHEVQAALSSAYEKGLLRGRKLLAAKRLIEVRRKRGKAEPIKVPKPKDRLSADALVRVYQEETDRKKMMLRRAEATRNRLTFVIEAIRKLTRDEQFLGLLEDEGLSSVPENIAARLARRV